MRHWRGKDFDFDVVPIGLEALYTIWIRTRKKIGKSRMAITSKTPALLGLLKEIKTVLQGKSQRAPIIIIIIYLFTVGREIVNVHK